VARCRDGAGGGFALLTIFRVAETGSTNADMLAMAARGEAREGDWLIAERQTAGRGRMGRTWESPLGNFYGSTIVQLTDLDAAAPSLALVSGFALWCAVRGPSELKWPNDLLIHGAKVAGVLLERQQNFVIAGFGINVAVAPPFAGRLTTTVLEHAYVDGQDVAAIESDLVEHFARVLAIWRREGVSAVVKLWTSEAHALGTLLLVTSPDGARIEGQFEGLTEEGALRLRLPAGDIRVIHAGDVFLI
jgi:BirA family transcriptional regulator, biotin operon repressor / biotin---[acetyl-CoA-carboxylase] ligase